MKKFLFLALLICFPVISFSQTSLFIMDGDGYPFPGASIAYKNKLIGKTNKEGLIDVSKVPAGERVYITFKDLSASHVIQKKEKDEKRTLVVYLVPTTAIEAPPVVEEGNRSHSSDDDPPPPPPIPYSENDILTIVDKLAEFPGGREAMNKYLQENLKYPQTGACFEGKCYLQFVVDIEGNISNIKVLRGIPGVPECDQEAVNAIKGMPKWIPGKVNGKSVNSYYQMSVNFSIN